MKLRDLIPKFLRHRKLDKKVREASGRPDTATKIWVLANSPRHKKLSSSGYRADEMKLRSEGLMVLMVRR